MSSTPSHSEIKEETKKPEGDPQQQQQQQDESTNSSAAMDTSSSEGEVEDDDDQSLQLEFMEYVRAQPVRWTDAVLFLSGYARCYACGAVRAMRARLRLCAFVRSYVRTYALFIGSHLAVCRPCVTSF